MDIRPATEDDLAGIRAVRLAIDRDAHEDSGADPGYCRYLIEHGRLLVGVDHGRVTGFAGAVETGSSRLLADLFIDPDRQGSGVGRALLTEVLAGSSARYTFSSSDPRAMPIYTRAGMLPQWPLLYVHGPRGRIERPAGLVTEEIGVVEATAFELSVTGHDRSSQYRYWASRPGALTIGVRRGAELVAAGALVVRQRTVRIEHLACVDTDDVEVFAALVHCEHGAERVIAYVPGPRRLTSVLLAAGFRIHDTDTYMASGPNLIDDRLMVVHPGLG